MSRKIANVELTQQGSSKKYKIKVKNSFVKRVLKYLDENNILFSCIEGVRHNYYKVLLEMDEKEKLLKYIIKLNKI